MDLDKWNALTALVREARVRDAETLAAMTAATVEWKAANKVLSERLDVLNGYVTEQQNLATAVGESLKP